jgi:hypothetical protein
MDETTTKAQQAVHEALQSYIDEGEILVGWCAVIDVAGPDDVRYLLHCAGGGHDGAEAPPFWAARGMLEHSAEFAASLVEAPEDDE